MNKKYISFIFIDILIVTLSFLIAIWPKPATIRVYLPSYTYLFIYYAINLVFISLILGKYDRKSFISLKIAITTIVKSNLVLLGVISLFIIIFKEFQISRFVFFLTIILINIFEILLASFYVSSKRLNKSAENLEKLKEEGIFNSKREIDNALQKETPIELISEARQHRVSVKYFVEEFGEAAYSFLSRFIKFDSERNAFFATTTRFNIEKLPDNYFQNIINIKKINNIRFINKFFESINRKLPQGGFFIGRVETNYHKKTEVLRMFGYIGYIVLFFYFIFKRMFPKMALTKRFYFYITNGKERALSKAEALGRLVSCGFEIIEYDDIDNLLYFVVKKVREPFYDLNPSYGPFFKMKRAGKNGKFIYVYKFRTMHPYAEYLQDYVIKLHGYSEKGKPANDFRLTAWGKFFRRFYLDELPQLINVFKGEMKLVGVRPVSKSYLSEYPEDILKLRYKQKPGCIPPYIALNKPGLKGSMESDRVYMLEREKHPIFTDIKFFFKAIYNILTNKVSSA